MPGKHPFQVEGRVIEVLSAKTYRVELVNGHRFLGFVAGRRLAREYRPGEMVNVQFSPYDLSEGRILVENE